MVSFSRLWNYNEKQVTFDEDGHIWALIPSPCPKWMTLIIESSAFALHNKWTTEVRMIYNRL